MIHMNNKRRLTVLGATADPEVQYLVFPGVWVLARVVAHPHPQAPPGPRHLREQIPSSTYIWADRKMLILRIGSGIK